MTNINFLYGYPVEFRHLCMVYPPKVCDTFKKKLDVAYTLDDIANHIL